MHHCSLKMMVININIDFFLPPSICLHVKFLIEMLTCKWPFLLLSNQDGSIPMYFIEFLFFFLAHHYPWFIIIDLRYPSQQAELQVQRWQKRFVHQCVRVMCWSKWNTILSSVQWINHPKAILLKLIFIQYYSIKFM